MPECLQVGPAGRGVASRAVAVLVILATALALASAPAAACTIDNKPSASANGRMAVLNRVTGGLLPATWAPFVFVQPIHHGVAVVLAEDNNRLRRVLPSDAFKHSWQWTFGDGSARAAGTRLRHTYTRSGTYRITVRFYYGLYHSWQIFDEVTIHVR